jgi:hypothetical protein
MPRRARHLPPRHHQITLPIPLPTQRHPETPANSGIATDSKIQKTSSIGCCTLLRPIDFEYRWFCVYFTGAYKACLDHSFSYIFEKRKSFHND